MKKLIYLFLTVLIVACSSEDGSNNQSSCNGDNPVYLADNGVTIKACDDAEVYSTGIINGETYTVVNEIVLRDMLENEEDVSRVVTTKVTDMSSMFPSSSSENEVDEFNQDISHWDVSNVTNMERMFYTLFSFDQPLNNWDVSNVTTMREMFLGAYYFNQDISSWDVNNVTDMSDMFVAAGAFNQDISSWDVSNVTSFSFMFYRASSFNQPIGNWNTSNVTNMRSTFKAADNFNQSLANWDVSNVTTMYGMFGANGDSDAEPMSFNQDISSWDVSNVLFMNYMFYDNTAFNQDLSSWDVESVGGNCSGFNQGTPQWTLPKPDLYYQCLE